MLSVHPEIALAALMGLADLCGLSTESAAGPADPAVTFHALWTPDDPLYNAQQYGPRIIQADLAWDITRGSASVVVAVVDSGVLPNHPDLFGKVVAGYDFVDDDGNPSDVAGHGTVLSGIVGAMTNNSFGIAGVTPETRILSVRVLDGSGVGTSDDVAAGITYAADQGAQVILTAFGAEVEAPDVAAAVSYALAQGAVVVAAAGDGGTDAPSYPAHQAGVIAVAATDAADAKAPFSSYGTWVDVAAPGEAIVSTAVSGGYSTTNGSSQAAAHVAGVAALLAAQGLDADEIRSAILANADPIPGTGTYWAYGRVDAYAALVNGGCSGDADGDGVLDCLDDCPLDPANDADGDGLCGDEDDCPLDPSNDADGDGLCGDEDDCPLDPSNDADGDGLCGDQDPCPDHPDNADPDGDGLGNGCDDDDDGDGVTDGDDLCPGTAIDQAHDTLGCTIDQHCPCAGPSGANLKWKNHGQYQSCVTKTAKSFEKQGLVTKKQRKAIVKAAAQSDCGHHPCKAK